MVSNASPFEVIQQKIVVAGGFGVGKTTMVGSISEITPLRTEALLTEASNGIDDLTHTAAKNATTVAMDFGRITLREEDIQLLLFGTPGQERFWFMWDDLCRGAIGAVVMVDTRRAADSFPAVDYFEQRELPFLVAINDFPATHRYPAGEVREALNVSGHVPIVHFDARHPRATRDVLVRLLRYALEARLTTA